MSDYHSKVNLEGPPVVKRETPSLKLIFPNTVRVMFRTSFMEVLKVWIQIPIMFIMVQYVLCSTLHCSVADVHCSQEDVAQKIDIVREVQEISAILRWRPIYRD